MSYIHFWHFGNWVRFAYFYTFWLILPFCAEKLRIGHKGHKKTEKQVIDNIN
jgi:hypothetical protein